MCNRIHTSCKAPAGSTPLPTTGDEGSSSSVIVHSSLTFCHPSLTFRHSSSFIRHWSFVIRHSSSVLLQRIGRSGEVAIEAVASEDIFRQERLSFCDQTNQIQGCPLTETPSSITRHWAHCPLAQKMPWELPSLG